MIEADPRTASELRGPRWIVHQGVGIRIETARGETRSGVDPDGHPWSVTMPAHYGEVPGTIGADGDPVDVFVGPDPYAPIVFVAQFRRAGARAFDETKALLGFRDRAAAERVLARAYDRADVVQGLTEWPIGAWVAALQRPEVTTGRMATPLRKADRLVHVVGHQRVNADGTITTVEPHLRHVSAADLEPVPTGRRRVFRATTDPVVRHGAHLTERHEDAEEYTENPGFGGPMVFAYDVDPGEVLDATGHRNGLEDLAEAWLSTLDEEDLDDVWHARMRDYDYSDMYDRARENGRDFAPTHGHGRATLIEAVAKRWDEDGFDRVFKVLENVAKVQRRLVAAGHQWVRFEDDFPPGSKTWKYLGTEPVHPVGEAMRKAVSTLVIRVMGAR